MRTIIFNWLFNKHERTAIVNALWRRVDDDRSKEVEGENKIRETCKSIAQELMS
jgi:hypothetical protein